MAKAKVLSKSEIKLVMRIAETGNNGLRDKTALALSIYAGARIGEIAALTIGDVRGLDGKAVSVINLSKHQTKGSKSRRVFISAELQKLLNQYLATISDLNDRKAFIRSSRTGSHFSNISLSLRFKAIYRTGRHQNEQPLRAQDIRNAIERSGHRDAHHSECARTCQHPVYGALLRCDG